MSSSSSPPSPPVESSFLDRATEERLDVDRVLRALAHRRRREILGLLDEESTVTRAALVERLLDLGASGELTTAEELESTLVHRHLPKLEQAGLVVHEEESGLVRRGESYDTVRDMADAAASVEANP